MKLKGLKSLLIVPLFLSVSFVKEDASFIGKDFSFRAKILYQINQVRTQGCNCGIFICQPLRLLFGMINWPLLLLPMQKICSKIIISAMKV